MNIRRLALDVDKALNQPSLVDLAGTIEDVSGVQAVNITVTEIDMETIGMDITVEGEEIDYSALVKAIEHAGAVVNSVDHVAAGSHIVEAVSRKR